VAIAGVFASASKDLEEVMENLAETERKSEEELAASEENVAAAIQVVTDAMNDRTAAQMESADLTQTSIDAIKDYGNALSESDAIMSEWDGGIDDAQARLSELAKQVAEESREYTEKEKQEITDLIDVIDLYTEKKAELYQAKMATLALIISQESDLTTEQINAYMEELDGFYGNVESLANESYAQQLQQLQELYGETGELDQKAFDDGLKLAKEKKEQAIANAEDERDGVISVLENSTIQATELEMDYFNEVVKAQEEADKIKLDKKILYVAKMRVLEALYLEEQFSDASYLQLIDEETAKINDQYNQQIIDSETALAAAISSADKDMIAEKIDAYRELADAGVQIKASELEAINGYLDAIGEERISIQGEVRNIRQDIEDIFSGINLEAYDWAEDMIAGIVLGIEESRGGAYTAAEEMAKGIAAAYKRGLDQHSPSRVMQKAAVDTFSPITTEAKMATIQLDSRMHELTSVISDRSYNPVSVPQASNAGQTSGIKIEDLERAFENAMKKLPQTVLNIDGRTVATSSNNANGNMNRQYGKGVGVA
jgi:hypothetical protein